MIELYFKKLEEFWCGTALKDSKILTTAFGPSEENVFESLTRELSQNSHYHVAREKNLLGEEVLNVIGYMLQGRDVSFNFKFNMTRLSDYSQKVLRWTSLIPTGYVGTYGALASVAGGSPRSVGQVMAINPFAPIIPCHRVVAADMTLRGYGGGLKMKWWILQKEDRNYKESFELSNNGKTMKLYPICLLRIRDVELAQQQSA